MSETQPPHERRGFTVVVRGVPLRPYHLLMPNQPRKGLMRSLGEFVGHVAKGIRTDPAKKVVKHEVQEEVRETEGGQVTLRRTTIEEIEIGKTKRSDPT